MNRGAMGAVSQKEKALAQDILQGLATKDLTISQVKTVLDVARHMVNSVKFSCPVLQDVAEGDSSRNGSVR